MKRFLGLDSQLSQFGTCDVLASTETQDFLWDFLKLIIKRQVTLTQWNLWNQIIVIASEQAGMDK